MNSAFALSDLLVLSPACWIVARVPELDARARWGSPCATGRR
jgi:hypothetical protein